MIPLPIRRCSECGYVGFTRNFDVEMGELGTERRLRCPRCGHVLEQGIDARLK